MTRAAWANGRNYDAAKLTFALAARGFTLGESLLGGPDPLGADGADVPLSADFTSCTISSPTTVEDSLFVHRETETCTLTATMPSMVSLKGKRIAVAYGGVEVYRGTVRQVEWTETVDVGHAYLRGNTAIKTYRVSLVATSGEEALATAATPARAFTAATSVEARIASWTGFTTVTQASSPAFPLGLRNIGQDESAPGSLSWWSRVDAADQTGSLLETIRKALRLYSRTFTYRPWEAVPVKLWPSNRWLTTVAADSNLPLEFTDAVITPVALTGDNYIGQEARVSYTSRSYGDDPAMWADSAGVDWTLVGTPDVDAAYGPWRASAVSPSDTAVSLGRIGISDPPNGGSRIARAIVSTLPLKQAVQASTKSISCPLQSTSQLGGVVPGLANMTADGATSLVSVLGRTHSITPTSWLVSYDIGPHHLLDRESDLDPGCPVAVSLTYSGGQMHLSWKTPWLPPGSVWFARQMLSSQGYAGMTSWDYLYSSELKTQNATGQLKGDVQTLDIAPPGTGVTWSAFVAYSNNPSPSEGFDNPTFREGQVCYLGELAIP